MQTTTQEVLAQEAEEVPVNSLWAKVIFPLLLIVSLTAMLVTYILLFS